MQVVIRPIDIDQDAEGLAAMWNASDMQWPGSWTHGLPITAEMVREWENDRRHLVTFVAVVEGEIAGYCSFTDEHGVQSGEGYLALLNVHPKYQKQSIGRRLIQATIERSVQEGFQRQTLGTWSANFKAVPTYKKTGHFWTPDSSVWMQNFIPGALQLSLARPFFERHNWYTAYVRSLEQQEDDERWEGLKVFTQHWEADGESLTIWIDRQARAPMAVETDALQVAAIAENIEPLAGAETKIRWRVVNKATEPLPVYLHALGDKGLEIDHRDAFVVPGGETVERSAVVKIADDANGRKEDGTAPAVRSILRLGDKEVELFSGLRVQKPLSLDTDPAELSLAPKRRTALRLQLHSKMDRPAAAIIQLAPPSGLEVEWRQKRVELPAEGHLTIPLEVVPAGEGIYTLPVRVLPLSDEGEGFRPLDQTLTLFALGVGGLLACQGEGAVRIETDALRITIQGKGASIKLEHKDDAFALAELLPLIGPPYWPSEFGKSGFSMSLIRQNERVIVRLAGEARWQKGLFLLLDVQVSAAGVILVEAQLENRGPEPLCKRLRFSLNRPDEEGLFALALPQGIVESALPDYPTVRDDAPLDPSAYAEPWLAWQRGGAVAGVAWDEHIARVDAPWRTSLTTREVEIAAGGRSEPVRLMLYGGDGDWHCVRRAALRWSAGTVRATTRPSHPPYGVEADPGVVLTLDNEVALQVVADAASVLPERGQVCVETSAGLRAAPSLLAIEELKRGEPLRRSIRLQMGPPGAYGGHLHLDLGLREHTAPFHVLRLGKPSPVEVYSGQREGQEVWILDNGRSRFVLAPSFGPALIAWEQAGGAENLVWSPFPQRGHLAWFYPWFGGISPRVLPADSWCWEGFFYRESNSVEPLEEVDEYGLCWRGVCVGARPQKHELHDLAFELKWLTVGHSNTLKVVYSVRNLRPTAQRVRLGGDFALGLGADPAGLVLHGEELRRRATPWAAWFFGHRWGALSQPANGKAALLISNRHNVILFDAGQQGRMLASIDDLRLSGDERQELIYYVIVEDSLEKALAYMPLKDL